MKRLCWSCLKFGLLIFVIMSCALTILIQYKGSGFDPVTEIQKLRIENRRDDALDLARFYRENQSDGSEKFAMLEKELKYTTQDKIKSFAWDGMLKGEVYDSYSGMGVISADLSIIGDLRDIAIQIWRYLNDSQKVDTSIMLLSAGGICLSGTPCFDGIGALAKNTVKYLKRIPARLNKGLLKKFLLGKIPPQHFKKIWELLKKTDGLFHGSHPAYLISTI